MTNQNNTLIKAQERGKEDAQNGWTKADWADIADLILEHTTDEMDSEEYNAKAREVRDAYSKGYSEAKK